jgi:hypothetical protein
MKRFFAALIALFFIIPLSGCDSLMNLEGVLSPPRLTAQQNDIYEALKEQVGPDIQLCYPQNGNYRSAFIIKNIDNEPTEEAIVFYQPGLQANLSTELRINVLDQREDGTWVSACDIVGGGYEVDRVEFGNFGSNGETNVIIGYQRGSAEKKKFTIYRYHAGMLEGQNEFDYDIFSLLKMPGSDQSRLVFVGDTGVNQKAAMLVAWNSGGYQVEGSVPMYGEVYSYEFVTSGYITPAQPALFLDGYGYMGLCTQILMIRDGKLVNATFDGKTNIVSRTLREQKVFCSDVNGDGIVEIPSTVLMPGYQKLDPEAMYYTDWLAYTESGFTVTNTTFINASDGYRLTVPENWKEAVSAEYVMDQDEVKFYLNTPSGEKEEVLLQIRTVQRSDVEQTGLKQGFFRLSSVGQITYMAKINIDTGSEYRLSKDELLKRFSIIL